MYLIFDTETTGLPANYNAPVADSNNWPRMVQLAWQAHDIHGKFLYAKNYIVKPENYTIPYSAEKVHGISTQKAETEGHDLVFVVEEFIKDAKEAEFLVGHNILFDIKIVGAELYRKNIDFDIEKAQYIDTKEESTNYCALPGGRGGKYKWPNLSELHQKLFACAFEEAHNASADVAATARCFLELIRLEIIAIQKLGITADDLAAFKSANPDIIQAVEITIESNREKEETTSLIEEAEEEQQKAEIDNNISFVHLHLHSQYSILDGAADIQSVTEKAKSDGMQAIALTDHGNMFGVKVFHKTLTKAGLKPIIGCEVYVASRSRHQKEGKHDGGGNHLVLLAKNMLGYKNLMKLVSYGYTEGYYYKPRVDKELLKTYSEGLIALTACLGGVISSKILHEGPEAAQAELEEYKGIFGENLFLELQRHPTGDPLRDKEVYEDQVFANKTLTELAEKNTLRLVATNDVHFVNEEDAAAHDRLLCISTGKDVDDPNRLHYTRQEWFKTQQEMRELFADVPEALENTTLIADMVEEFPLDSDPIMPDFPLPEGFTTEDEYLRHITYEGARVRYGEEIPQNVCERIDFELETVERMGFPGYFLIVWDFIKSAREMDVSVGPGRGSAAGSVVAYSLGITSIDPMKYDLLFERFLNPDRISMPDIDIDFDEDGRDRVLQWVVNKYGKNRVAHIITFGTMAPKMAIRDVARVQKLELSEADRLAKLIPEKPGTTFLKAYKAVPELIQEQNSSNELVASTLRYAEVLEGSVRQTGVHACGIIIGKNNLEDHLPICINKDAELFVTQYDGSHVEDVGMLKMDFLGLKTLSIIKDAIENIQLSRGEPIDIDNITLDDAATYELFSRGETTALFQFESDGMKKHLKNLKPNRFEDLIAMNALYRPGPMEYIPSFINRKHGREKINYDLPEMEEYLSDTYGITVYQEQVMLLSRKLAGFSRGQADSLRKAMGKKIQKMMDELKVKFEEGCAQNGFPEEKVKKIWKDWEAFAQYAFNKSHSTCYAYVAYQTGYLKAHYPGEFMAAVLSRNLNDIKKIGLFMEECRRMDLKVLLPDVNESYARFTVNKNGNIRFGMAAIKGVGGAAVEHIVAERTNKGPFKDIYEFVERVNLNTVNKRTIEGLIMAGAFDEFNQLNRHQFFAPDDKGITFVEHLVRYGNKMQSETNAGPNLFGGMEAIEVNRPVPQEVEEWPSMIKLNKEKEHIGIFLSSHPLDVYKFELENLRITPLAELKNLKSLMGKDVTVVGLVTSAGERFTKKGNPFGQMLLEDYTDNYNVMMFSKDYLQFKSFFAKGYTLLIKGKVQEHPWRKDGELEFKITHMSMLSDVKEDYFKHMQISIPLQHLNNELIDELDHLTSTNGDAKIALQVKVFDALENMAVEMSSRHKKVALSDDFIHFLKSNATMEYTLV